MAVGHLVCQNCDKTFRTAGGVRWHLEHSHHRNDYSTRSAPVKDDSPQVASAVRGSVRDAIVPALASQPAGLTRYELLRHVRRSHPRTRQDNFEVYLKQSHRDSVAEGLDGRFRLSPEKAHDIEPQPSQLLSEGKVSAQTTREYGVSAKQKWIPNGLSKVILRVLRNKPAGLTKTEIVAKAKKSLPKTRSSTVGKYLRWGLKDWVEECSDSLFRLKANQKPKGLAENTSPASFESNEGRRGTAEDNLFRQQKDQGLDRARRPGVTQAIFKTLSSSHRRLTRGEILTRVKRSFPETRDATIKAYLKELQNYVDEDPDCKFRLKEGASEDNHRSLKPNSALPEPRAVAQGLGDPSPAGDYSSDAWSYLEGILSERSLSVVKLSKKQGMTFNAIAASVGVSGEWVRKIIEWANQLLTRAGMLETAQGTRTRQRLTHSPSAAGLTKSKGKRNRPNHTTWWCEGCQRVSGYVRDPIRGIWSCDYCGFVVRP